MTVIVVISANQISDLVKLYVPKSNIIQVYPVATFLEAWNATGDLCVSAFPDDLRGFKATDHIMLPEGCHVLRDAIVEKVHDRWKLEHQSEGRTFGLERNDSKLETSNNVPYSKLPKQEKQYDCIMVEETLKLLIIHGYQIEKNRCDYFRSEYIEISRANK